MNLTPHSVQLLDVAGNRRARNYSPKELAGRVLWVLVHPLFAWSPRLFWEWRCALLRLFGARIGRNVRIYPSVRIMIPWNLIIGDQSTVGDRAILYALGTITLDERVTVSQGAHLCAGTHDYRDPAMPLLKLPIRIGRDSWICADAFVGPDVAVGELSVVGARAVVMKDVADRAVVVGNPAQQIGTRTLNKAI